MFNVRYSARRGHREWEGRKKKGISIIRGKREGSSTLITPLSSTPTGWDATRYSRGTCVMARHATTGGTTHPHGTRIRQLPPMMTNMSKPRQRSARAMARTRYWAGAEITHWYSFFGFDDDHGVTVTTIRKPSNERGVGRGSEMR